MGSIIKVNEYKDFGNNAIMTSDGAGVITPNADGIKNTPAFMAYISGGNQMVTDATYTLIAANTERLDTDSCYDTSTYKFTPTAPGKYVAFSYVEGYSDGASQCQSVEIGVKKNGSFYHRVRFNTIANQVALLPNSINVIVEMNGSGDYLEFYGMVDGTAGNQSFVGDSDTQTYIGAYKLIGA